MCASGLCMGYAPQSMPVLKSVDTGRATLPSIPAPLTYACTRSANSCASDLLSVATICFFAKANLLLICAPLPPEHMAECCASSLINCCVLTPRRPYDSCTNGTNAHELPSAPS
jgi:hypothetical protein